MKGRRAPRRASALALAALALGALGLLGAPGAARACGGEVACKVQQDGATLGEYLYLPPPSGAVVPPPAIVFLHGWRATADAMARNAGLIEAAQREGAALVLPQGQEMTWSYPGSPARFRDEFRFFEALRTDLIARHGVDAGRIVISGFSMGASMAWNIACNQGSGYWGAVTFAGAFWDPIPEACPDPAPALFHTHGTADGVVPIEGRPIGAHWRQSDAHESLKRFTDGLAVMPEHEDERGFECREWREIQGDAPPTRVYEFCTHDRGHIFSGDWIARAIERLKAMRES